MSEYKRMQTLAGIINESHEGTTHASSGFIYGDYKASTILQRKFEDVQKDHPELKFYVEFDNSHIRRDKDIIKYSYSFPLNSDNKSLKSILEDIIEHIKPSDQQNESTVVTKTTDSSQISDIAKREKTDTTTVQSAINQAKQTGKPININESDPLTKVLRKLGWLGDSWTPQEYKTQVRELPDDILLKWYESKDNPIPNTPLEFQRNLVKSELERRGLINNNINEIFKNKMKKSEFKKYLKEEVVNSLSSTGEINEMAAIKGDIKTKVDQIIADNPDMEVGPLARLIMKDEEINAIIDRDNLSDMAQNQTQKYIKLVRGERELGQRGRKADPNKPKAEPKPSKPQSGFSTEDMVKDLEAYSDEEMEAEDRKWKGKFHLLNNKTIKSIWDKYMGKEVPSPTEKDIADPSNLNETQSADYMKGYGDGYTDGYHDGENGVERAVEVNEGNLNEMAKLTGGLADAIGAVIANLGDDLDGLALKKAIKADPAVIDALGDDTLYDNQLNKFIALAKGERELGQRGRKAGTGNAPKPKTEKPSLVDMVDDDDIDIEDEWTKTDTDFDDDFDEDKVKDVEIENNPSLDSERIQTLKDQETKKFWRNFVTKMKEEGVIGSDNKPLDKKQLESKRKEAQKELNDKLKSIK